MEASPIPADAVTQGDPMSVRALKDISFGSVAGMTAKVFEHPFDLTKVRLQAQVLDAAARFSGPLDCLAQTWRKEGLRGLYRGLPAPIVGAMAENATLFWTYTEFQNAFRAASALPASAELTLGQLALAGAGAGAITSFVLTPIELIKCKMQVQMLMAPALLALPAAAAHQPHTHSRRLPGPLSVLATTIRTTGLRGLWLGQTATFIRETGGGAAWFASKEAVAVFLRRGERRAPRAWESAASGACAGIAYNVALFPADTVKSAMQTEAELRPRSSGAPSPTFFSVFRQMYAAGGVRGLYAGCGITVARAIPSSALIFLIYDGLTRRFGG